MTSAPHEPENRPRPTLLRQLAELDRLEPSASLDRAVMRQARESIRPARRSRIRHSARWVARAALAALVTFALWTGYRPTRPARPSTGVSASLRVVGAPPSLRAVGASASSPGMRVTPVVALEDARTLSQSLGSPAPSLVATEAPASEPLAGARRVQLETHPAEWLGRIEQLRTEGRTEEADREWAAFLRIYPRYPGPAAGAFDPLTVTSPAK